MREHTRRGEKNQKTQGVLVIVCPKFICCCCMLISRGTAPEQPVELAIAPKWPNEFVRILNVFIKFENFNEF